jgi:hypothetical protein
MLGLSSLLTLALSAPPAAQSTQAPPPPDERAAIEQVARDYLEGWYAADPERIGRALHPDLAKRYVHTYPSGRQAVQSVTREVMVEMTRAGGGSKLPAEKRNVAAQVLEISGDIAVVRASSSEYLEYLSLAKCNGRWQIVNVLWRFQSRPEGRQ